MVRSNGSGDTGMSLDNEVHRMPGGDVFQHHAQLREALQQRNKMLFNKQSLAIKNIYRWVSQLAMN